MIKPLLKKARKAIGRARLSYAHLAGGAKTRLGSRSQRFCLFCERYVEAWRPYRGGAAEKSQFLVRVDSVGSRIDRFSCPNCSSTDRERHLHLFFDRLGIWRTIEGSAILHMAPEPQLGEAIRKRKPSVYVKGDLFPADETLRKIDLEAIAYPDETFDIVICNHILEHVAAPAKALAEVRRVLKPGGRLVCQTPFASRLSRTFEDELLSSPDDRQFFYGQEDHVRLFGLDIEPMIVAAGFSGRLTPHQEILPDVDPEQLGVNEKEPFFDFVRSWS